MFQIWKYWPAGSIPSVLSGNSGIAPSALNLLARLNCAVAFTLISRL